MVFSRKDDSKGTGAGFMGILQSPTDRDFCTFPTLSNVVNLISQLQFVSNMFSCQNKVLTHANFPLKLVSRFKFIQVLKAFEVIELQYLKFTLVPESGLCGMAERRLLNDLMEYYQVTITHQSNCHQVIIAYFQKLERPVANESDAVQLKEWKAVNSSLQRLICLKNSKCSKP